ncbi:unnamed protein product, partial [Scytosiphon promiscuus]
SIIKHARRKRCRAIGYLETLSPSRSATRQGILEVGRALRAIDFRLKVEWMRWAEDATVSCGGSRNVVQHQKHPRRDDPPSMGKACDSTGLLERWERVSRVARTTVSAKGHATASLGDPSAQRSGSPCRRRHRRLRAWCSKAWGSFRPTTNADLSPPPNETPAHELVFLRKGYGAFEKPKLSPKLDEDRAKTPRHSGGGIFHRLSYDDGARKCAAAAVTEAHRTVAVQAVAFGSSSKQGQLPVLVPSLRSGSAECLEVFPSATNVDGLEGRSPVLSEKEDNEIGTGCVVGTGGTPADPYAREQPGRRKGLVAASVRAGDWVLPTHGGGGFAWNGTSVRRGGSDPALKGGNNGSRWMRVEVVSICRDECIILATPGTGGTRNMKLRASLKLVRLSLAVLPGALVVRQMPSSGRSGGGLSRGHTNGEGCEGAGITEAFQLPVLCARWGLRLLREWATADTACQPPNVPALSEENARRRHRSRLSGAAQEKERRGARGEAGSTSRSTSTTKKLTATAGGRELEDGGRGVRLRLATPAGERELSLAWTGASAAHFRDEVSVELFTPGGCKAWTSVYRGLAGRFDVEGMEPCRRYRFRARSLTSGRRGGWRHTSFCTRPDRPHTPLATRWTPGVPAVGFHAKNVSLADKSAMGEGCVRDRGTSGCSNLHLQLGNEESYSACFFKDVLQPPVRETLAHGTPQNDLGEDCGSWVVEYRTRLQRESEQLWCTGSQAALEWAGGTKAKRVDTDCYTNPPKEEHRLGGVGSNENDDGRSAHSNSETEPEDHVIQHQLDRGTGWKLVYRGKRPECVVGSLAQGTHYAFRCARANADGLVGPWSNHLRCLVPVASGKSGGSSSSSGNEDGALARAEVPPPPGGTPVLQKRRFDLLVPALVEAFARLVDDGEHRILHAATPTTGRTSRTPRLMPPRPPPSSSPPPPYLDAKQTAPKTSANKTPQTGGMHGPRGHPQHHHQSSGARLAWEGEASTPWNETGRTVWEEHWDSERRAPFFRLRGEDLSVWQIPAL